MKTGIRVRQYSQVKDPFAGEDDPKTILVNKVREFDLTPRRKEILWHIAYTWEVVFTMEPNFTRGGWRNDRVPVARLNGVNIHQIVMLLKRAKLVHFDIYRPWMGIHITPRGMQVLLDTLN